MTKKYRNVMQPHLVVESITCNRCNRTYDTERSLFEVQEFLCWENHAGWGSVFGDMNMVTLELCQHCVKEVLGPYVRVNREEPSSPDTIP